MNSQSDDDLLDALIVGAGFGGVYQLKHLRDNGFKVKLVDFSSSYGGVWYWNRYPGARVDVPVPHYQYEDPELWKGFVWKERFPSSAEMREYFEYVAEKWDLRKDSEFNTFISSANFDDKDDTWHISSSDGKVYRSRMFLVNTGFAAKRHTPDWKGINTFKGIWVHPSFWPKEEPDLSDKKVAVIGTGATGIQLAQEFAKRAKEFVLFQRTPNTCLPMKQIDLEREEPEIAREQYPEIFSARLTSFPGFSYSFMDRGTFDDTPEKRKEVYEDLWSHGDFHYHLATYKDMMVTEEANKEAYNFWKEKVRARLNDPRLRELLAPDVQPYHFGCKRISLENGFYEIFDQPNVTLVDLRATPVEEITERGIKTTEREWDFDYVVCATGFDSFTGGLLQMNIRGLGGQSLGEKWADGVKTYLGMCVSNFPNFFFTYGPQAPSPLCNGPTCAQHQGKFILNVMKYMRARDLKRVNALPGAERHWVESVKQIADMTLMPKNDTVGLAIFHYRVPFLTRRLAVVYWSKHPWKGSRDPPLLRRFPELLQVTQKLRRRRLQRVPVIVSFSKLSSILFQSGCFASGGVRNNPVLYVLYLKCSRLRLLWQIGDKVLNLWCPTVC